jgi:hypothetical protein
LIQVVLHRPQLLHQPPVTIPLLWQEWDKGTLTKEEQPLVLLLVTLTTQQRLDFWDQTTTLHRLWLGALFMLSVIEFRFRWKFLPQLTHWQLQDTLKIILFLN